MSLINKMLQDLDRRAALATPEGNLPPRQVRAVSSEGRSREWFWRVLAVLMVIALAWVGWLAWQLRPRSLVNEEAIRAAREAAPKPVAVVSRPVPPPVAEKPAPAPEKPAPTAAPVETLRLAQSIDTPIPERAAPKPPAGPAALPARTEGKLPVPATPKSAQEAAKPEPVAAAPVRVERREKARTPVERSEAEFRRGTALLSQARVSEAEAAFAGALAADSGHEAARQALVSLLIERGRLEEARQLLREGLALNPRNVQFATVLARIQAERRDYAGALETLRGAQPAAHDNAEFHSLMATVLQRLSRHAEAVEAYRLATSQAPQSGTNWVGLGISLEALQRHPEAAEAFRRAVGTGTLSAELKTYAEQRARILR
jgi:MSHA biogenesis protein MshN